MNYFFCLLIGYLVGSVNPAYILAKLRGFDIREKGSKNAGASNALIVLGKMWGILCALLDIAKAYLAILLCETLFPDFAFAFAITGTSCILGHIFPFYMKFKGGKGTACLGGMVLYFDWRVFLIMLSAVIVIVLVTDYLCFMPTIGSVAFPFVYGFIRSDIWGALMLSIVPLVILLKNIENFNRIKNGTEMRISYLWKPQKEVERMKSNLSASGEKIDEALLAKHQKQ